MPRCQSFQGDGYEVVAGAESTAEIVLLAAQMLGGLVNYTDVATTSDVNVCCGCMVWPILEMFICVASTSKLVRTVVMFEPNLVSNTTNTWI